MNTTPITPPGEPGVKGNRLALAPLAAVWVAVVALPVAWLLMTSTGALREQLKTLQFWSLEACFVVVVISAVWLARDIRERLARPDYLQLLALSLIATALLVLLPPRTNRIFYDEQIYQSLGQNMTDLRRAQLCNAGVVEYGRLQCWSSEYNKQPHGYPHLLSVGFRLFGVRPAVALAINMAATIVGVCALYLLAVWLFGDRTIAWFAGLSYLLMPEQLLWSSTTASEPWASAACILAVLAASTFMQSRSHGSLFAAAALAAYALQFRPESIVVLPVVAIVIAPGLIPHWRSLHVWWAGSLFIALIAAHLGHLVAVRHEPWGSDGARFSFEYLAQNLRVNAPFYVADERFPAALGLLALIGAAWRGAGRGRATAAAWFLAFFSVAAFFYAGSYNFGADVRYSLMTYPPVALLAGRGIGLLAAWGRTRGLRTPVWAATVLLFGQFTWYVPLVRAVGEEAWAARADAEFARSVASELPANSFVLTHNPGMFHVLGQSAGQMSVLSDNLSYLEFLEGRFGGNVYMHWNFWCNVQDRVQVGYCRTALAAAQWQLVRETRVRDQRFAFYRLNR